MAIFKNLMMKEDWIIDVYFFSLVGGRSITQRNPT
jgi:hypothetical protein